MWRWTTYDALCYAVEGWQEPQDSNPRSAVLETECPSCLWVSRAAFTYGYAFVGPLARVRMVPPGVSGAQVCRMSAIIGHT